MSNRQIVRAGMAAVALAAASPALARAQGAPLQLSEPTPRRVTLEDQMRHLNAQVTADVSAKRISPANALIIQRELNGVQGQLGDARDGNGGHATLSERFDLQAQLDRIADEIRKDSVGAGERTAP